MGSDHRKLEEKRALSDDNFVVEMEPFSLITDEQMNVNPSFTRNISRKGSSRVGDSNPIGNQRVTATSLYGGSTPEKAALVAADDSIAPPLHHLIMISNGSISNTAAVKSKLLAKKFSFRRQISIDPRRMFLFFATMSSLGSMLLIYLTLSSVRELDGCG
ncbi:uncharacterized protein [Primulina eburnea]|uniref:uncharacterized protein isoform X2 n=1 Tax=Primulina eburnea TaxID=1245227 RepID=UPI003C6CC348